MIIYPNVIFNFLDLTLTRRVSGHVPSPSLVRFRGNSLRMTIDIGLEADI